MPGLHILFAPPDLALPCALFPEEAAINGLSQSTSDLQLPKGFSQWEALAGNWRERGKERGWSIYSPSSSPTPAALGQWLHSSPKSHTSCLMAIAPS